MVRYLEAVFYESLAQRLPRVKPQIGPTADGEPPVPAGAASSIIVSSAPNGGSGGVNRLFLRNIGMLGSCACRIALRDIRRRFGELF